MKCQSFQFFAGVFALTFASGLTPLHAGNEAALDTGTIETITGLKGDSHGSVYGTHVMGNLRSGHEGSGHGHG